ncbi:Collagenase, partial [Caligus rogercresseyi]
CLPTRAHIDETFIGVNATLTGWGVNGYDHKYNYPELYYAKDIPVVKCPWPQEILCTSGKDSSVCFGDSGGPINYEFEAGKYMQIGVNQFVTNGHCLGGFNGYARFTTHLDFIQETTGMIFE